MSPRILVCDDSTFDRTLFIRRLRSEAGYEVQETKSGQECLNLIHTQVFDLILLDLLMPDTSGIQVLSKIREWRSALELPVIVVTVKNETSDIVELLRLGANDYITKPVNFAVMLSRINTHLQLAKLSRDATQAKEISAMAAIVATYNHELNNPLTIAIGALDNPQGIDVATLRQALWRIADIVQKTSQAIQGDQIEFEAYGESSKTLRLK